jgi:hypothetical protein
VCLHHQRYTEPRRAFSARLTRLRTEGEPEREIGDNEKMYGTWKNKTDPQQHPVRFLAALWQKRLADNPRVSGLAFAGQQYGQLKQLKDTLGDLTQHVIEWMLKPENWWRFSQHVRTEGKLYRVPDDPEIGFLLKHCNRALRIMRWELRHSTDPVDLHFCAEIDRIRLQQLKSLLLVYAAGHPEQLAKIASAKTLTDMQRVFIEIMDAQMAA